MSEVRKRKKKKRFMIEIQMKHLNSEVPVPVSNKSLRITGLPAKVKDKKVSEIK